MGIYTKVISVIKPITGIQVWLGNEYKSIVGVYTFINGQRVLIYPEASTLLFTQTTAGAFSFQMPAQYDFAFIEYAGAGAANGVYLTGGVVAGEGGRGNILQNILSGVSGKTISGTVGAKGAYPNGGIGFTNGNSGQTDSRGGSDFRAGGAGGSTGFVFNDVTYEASSGGGATMNSYLGGWYHVLGGNGVGPYGGLSGASNNEGLTNGNDATDPNSVGYNKDTGYIKIWGIANPSIKPTGSI